MDEVNIVSLAVVRCVDSCCLLLDLLVRAFCWLFHLLSGLVTALHSMLVALSSSSLIEYWNFALFSFLTATEAVSCAACGALQTLGGVLESFKMVGHLICHLAWRIKDLLHRGFLSGSSILRQTCEGLCIALSLVLYFVNTVVNIVLISTQNCASVLAGVWEVVAVPVHRVLDLALTLLTFLYSCLVGVSVLLWTPCQLLLDFLSALVRVFLTVLTMDSHLMFITAVLIFLALLFLNPRLSVLAAHLSLRLVNALPGAGHIRTILEHTLINHELHTWIAREESRARSQRTHTGSSITENDLPETEPSPPNPLQLHTQRDGDPVSRCRSRPSKNKSPEVSVPLKDVELLSLLKEQEERKKCVICQDRSKTVLLLPCRHLCLCRLCADILTQRRAVQQRCCPLCRQPITQTMDVFL